MSLLHVCLLKIKSSIMLIDYIYIYNVRGYYSSSKVKRCVSRGEKDGVFRD